MEGELTLPPRQSLINFAVHLLGWDFGVALIGLGAGKGDSPRTSHPQFNLVQPRFCRIPFEPVAHRALPGSSRSSHFRLSQDWSVCLCSETP